MSQCRECGGLGYVFDCGNPTDCPECDGHGKVDDGEGEDEDI